jgi:hypothetical protein
MTKPSLFVGSSSEGLEIARAVAVQLNNDAETTVWNEGVFAPGQGNLESLVNALERFDFAALVLTPDDLVQTRDVSSLSPRDNVMFELGLFMGRLGRSRTFIVCSATKDLKLPSDLAGVTVLHFDSDRSDKNILAALGPACFQMRQAIRDLGVTEARSMVRLGTATAQVESVSAKLLHLVNLLTRSRALEMDVIQNQFGRFLPSGFLDKLKADLKDLEAATGDRT